MGVSRDRRRRRIPIGATRSPAAVLGNQRSDRPCWAAQPGRSLSATRNAGESDAAMGTQRVVMTVKISLVIRGPQVLISPSGSLDLASGRGGVMPKRRDHSVVPP